MKMMVFVGSPEDRYEAEKMFGKAPEVNLVRTFDTTHSFLQDLKRDEHLLHTAILCVPDDEFAKVKEQVLISDPNALVIKHAMS